MIRFLFRRIAMATSLIFLLGNVSRAEQESPQTRPNVLFIAVDDLRPSVGCYGDEHAVTPHIDMLAQSGVRFNQAHCQVAVCNPSRASLMTGLRPDKLGVWTLPIHFREAMPDAVTLPQWFRKFGYTAVSHGKIFHNPTPDPQSWSEPIRPLPPIEGGYADGTKELIQRVQASLPPNDWRKRNLRGPSTAAPEVDDNQLVDGARTDMAIEDLRRLAKGHQPFFLAMGYIRPHLPWVAPKKYWDLHDPTALPVIRDGKVTSDTPKYALSNNYELAHYVDLIDFPAPHDPRKISEDLARHLMHAYYASASYIDAQIGRLLKAFKEEGLTENTIIILWSDHGWKLGEYRGWGKMSNYEIDTRVPLIVVAPGMPNSGATVENTVELLDIYPTLCDLAGIAQPQFLDGDSLLPMLKNPQHESSDAAFSQYYRRLGGNEYMGYAIRTPSYRYVEWRDFRTGEVKANELYDHRQDHSESVNVIQTAPPAVVKQLTTKLLASHPRIGLTMTPSVHSNPNLPRFEVPISFANQTSGEVMIYPITPKGRRGRSRTLKPQENISIPARIGGVFVVESRDGAIHQIHSPSFPEKTVTIVSQSDAP